MVIFILMPFDDSISSIFLVPQNLYWFLCRRTQWNLLNRWNNSLQERYHCIVYFHLQFKYVCWYYVGFTLKVPDRMIYMFIIIKLFCECSYPVWKSPHLLFFTLLICFRDFPLICHTPTHTVFLLSNMPCHTVWLWKPSKHDLLLLKSKETQCKQVGSLSCSALQRYITVLSELKNFYHVCITNLSHACTHFAPFSVCPLSPFTLNSNFTVPI